MRAHADAFARRRLSRERDVGLADREIGIQRDESRHREHDGARPVVAGQRIAQAARPAVIEIRDFYDDTTAPAASEAAVSLGIRKGEMPRAEIPDRALRRVADR